MRIHTSRGSLGTHLILAYEPGQSRCKSSIMPGDIPGVTQNATDDQACVNWLLLDFPKNVCYLPGT